eukprot:CAMPEP_0182526392 /NCGR_PEP_ID=MMETSP1323-20130603/3151_1 /TAXON_ID=236787 /ORGANISM="Florenciella parvula, Strain RCC1693" /LENGTH=197 /DNA_ID=CAMNT_0024735241 /DNA_START=13 /DNA_END=606 /DNA_ORIENTATION=+
MMRLLALLTVAVATTDALVQAPSRHRPRMASARMSAAPESPTDLDGSSRRGFGSAVATGVVALALGLPPSPAQAAGNAELIATVKEARKLLTPLPDQLEAEQWDTVRTVLKNPPVGLLWNLGESKNPLKLIAKSMEDPDVFDAVDEISTSIQICDQFTYDNVFIYYQPGDGKIKKKEPINMVKQAMKQLDAIIPTLE